MRFNKKAMFITIRKYDYSRNVMACKVSTDPLNII